MEPISSQFNVPVLTNDNFLIYAMKAYDNPNCTSTLEFYDDLGRIRYIKRLFKRYFDTGELRVRLILNHFTVLYNVFFPPSECTRLIVLKLKDFLPQLKPFLIHMNYWPDYIQNVEKEGVILDSDVPLDQTVVDSLRKEVR